MNRRRKAKAKVAGNGVEVTIDQHTDLDAAIEQALCALALRDIGKPLAQCTPEELEAAWGGMDFDIPSGLPDEVQ